MTLTISLHVAHLKAELMVCLGMAADAGIDERRGGQHTPCVIYDSGGSALGLPDNGFGDHCVEKPCEKPHTMILVRRVAVYNPQ
jgi:hypothetical protein